MKNIIIIGNSAAGVACAKAIRENDKESKITIVSAEARPAYLRHQLLDFLHGRIKESALFSPFQDFHTNNSIELLLDRRIVNIDEKKRRIYFKDSGYLDFEILVLACGRMPQLPEIKGITKKGVFSLYYFDDVKAIIETLPIAHTACVIGSGKIASEVVTFLCENKVDTKWFTKEIPAEPHEHLEVISDSQVNEILGNGDAKAVRLSNNKVIGANIVVFTDALAPNIDLVKETSLARDKGILVDQNMATNVLNIFAAGDAAQFNDREKQYSWIEAEQEGITAGRSICQI